MYKAKMALDKEERIKDIPLETEKQIEFLLYSIESLIESGMYVSEVRKGFCNLRSGDECDNYNSCGECRAKKVLELINDMINIRYALDFGDDTDE